MLEAKDIKQDIISSIGKADDALIEKVSKELDIMSESEGLNNMSCLEYFYQIWKGNRSSKGNKNDINSWTAYALGMTSAKPDGEFLPSRRVFARAGFPDIDADFDDERRSEVYQYMIEKYGRENVGNIGTYMSLKMKAALRSIIRATDAADAYHKGPEEYRTANFQLANEISDAIGGGYGGIIKARDEDGKEVVIKTIKDAYKYIPNFRSYMDQHPDILKHAANLEGLVGTFSQHAAGVVISDVPLRTLAPLRKASRGDGLATQYTMEDLESVGLIKFDILAIAALTFIRDALDLIKKNYNIDVDIKNLPLDDSNTLSLYRSGKLNGVFQCESGGMQATLRDIGVDRFDDVIAAIALYRPGPMDSIPEYIGRKNGTKKIDYFHPSIEPFAKPYLKQTYSVLVYQEQLMQLCNSLAGFTITDGYVMIKAVGKKKSHLMNKFENQFIQGCVKNKIPENVAKQYWDKFITPFASYGFNLCLSGDTCVYDKNSKQYFRLEDLSEKSIQENEYVLDSWTEEGIVEDEIVDVFCTGEKDIYEVTLEDGSVIECTLNHKFLCSDEKFREVKEITEEGYEILSFDMEENYHNEVSGNKKTNKQKILSVKYKGKKKSYNLTMKSEQHNYAVSDKLRKKSFISKNSHSCCYAYLSYQTAYLKANFPDEYTCAFLNTFVRRAVFKSPSSWDQVAMMEQDAKKVSGIKFLNPDLSTCKPLYEIVRKKDKNAGILQTEIRPSLCCKGVGWEAAKEIERNQPYEGIDDFAARTNSKNVNTETLSYLIDAGFFKGKSGIKQKDALVQRFAKVRNGLKASAKKGIKSQDMFS